jgi:rsbT co-antagonist protein RsbR
MKKAIETGKTYSDRAVVPVKNREVTVEYYAVPLKDQNDEIVGGLEFAVDITRQVQYEENLIEQSRTIQQLSTPTIRLWDGILVLPIVGVIDSMRAQSMMESMLNKIVETYSKVIILDIQGVAAVDTAVAQHLIKIAKATKLMGCVMYPFGDLPRSCADNYSAWIDMDSVKQKPPSATRFRKRSIC